jgi:membrane protein YdbS with pleckstrin-like domain
MNDDRSSPGPSEAGEEAASAGDLAPRGQLVRTRSDDRRFSLSVVPPVSDQERVLWAGVPSDDMIRGCWLLAGLWTGSLAIAAGATAYAGLALPITIALAVASLLPLAWAAWRQAVLRHMTYELTTERLRVSHGIVSLDVDDVELYRIKDIHVRQPLMQRFFGLGTIIVYSADVTLPRCRIYGQPITLVRELREQLRFHTEDLRDRKVVREHDVR